MIDLTICSRAMTGKILNNPKYKIDFLVSIGDPDRDPPSGYHRFPPSNRLKLTFFDYITRENDYDWIRQQPYHSTIEDINQVITFTHDKIKPVMGSVLVHCEVGVSRSPAIAQIILQELGMTTQEAKQKILEVRPQAVPNEFVFALYESIIQTPNKQ